METIRVDLNGGEILAFYCQRLPKGKELDVLVSELCKLNVKHKSFLLNNNRLASEELRPSILLSFDADGKKVISDVYFEVFKWVSNVMDVAMPSGMGAELSVPIIFQLRNIDNNEPVIVIPIMPVERINKSQRGVNISKGLLRRIN